VAVDAAVGVPARVHEVWGGGREGGTKCEDGWVGGREGGREGEDVPSRMSSMRVI